LAMESGRLGPDTDLIELGFDSLLGMQLIRNIQETYAIHVYPNELAAHPSIGALAKYLESQLADEPVRAKSLESVPTKNPVLARQVTIEPPVAPSKVNLVASLAPTPSGKITGNPVIFVLSSPRAGSTLLRVMLAGHSR